MNKRILLAGVGIAGALLSGAAMARVDVGIGVNLGVPGVVLGGPAYMAPAPVYMAPPPVYVAPPAPVYYPPAPVYIRPPVVYPAAVYYPGPRFRGYGYGPRHWRR